MTGTRMPKWVKSPWQCPHCEFKTTDFEELMKHAHEVGLVFFGDLDNLRL